MKIGKIWNRIEVTPDEPFAYLVSQELSTLSPDPQTLEEARQSSDWLEWEKAINSELDSFILRHVLGRIELTLTSIYLTGYRWTFVKKINAHGIVVRYKARLVAKNYTQIPGRDFDQTYSPVMYAITYRYLITFSIQHHLRMHQRMSSLHTCMTC